MIWKMLHLCVMIRKIHYGMLDVPLKTKQKISLHYPIQVTKIILKSTDRRLKLCEHSYNLADMLSPLYQLSFISIFSLLEIPYVSEGPGQNLKASLRHQTRKETTILGHINQIWIL